MRTEKDIVEALQFLDAEQLNKVAIYITDLRRAVWTVEPPVGDERPEPSIAGHERRTTPHGQAEPFRGKQTTPIPLNEMGGKNE